MSFTFDLKHETQQYFYSYLRVLPIIALVGCCAGRKVTFQCRSLRYFLTLFLLTLHFIVLFFFIYVVLI